MPTLSPYYWCMCGFVMVGASIVGVTAGLSGYSTIAFITKRSRPAAIVGRPVGIVMGVFAFLLAFPVILGWVSRDWSRPTVEPARSDLVGTWVVSTESLRKMHNEGRYAISTHSLGLRENGTLEYINMPDWWRDFGESSGKVYSGSGTWRVVQEGDYWNVRANLDGFASMPIIIARDQTGYYLYGIIGDPDTGGAMIFHKP